MQETLYGSQRRDNMRQKLIRRYKRQVARAEERERSYEEKKERLSEHGYYMMGFFAGVAYAYANAADDLEDVEL